jgi:hypothetical protein
MPVALPRQDCRPRAVVAPDALAVFAKAPCLWATTENDPWITVSNSIQNASTSIAATRLVRVTHPFHPLSGKQLACVGERHNRYGRRLLLQVDDVTVRSVPPQWTDLVAPDPEIVIGEHRAVCRVADLLALAQLVDQLRRRDPFE